MTEVTSHEVTCIVHVSFHGDGLRCSSFFYGSGKRHQILRSTNCVVICYVIVEPLGLEHCTYICKNRGSLPHQIWRGSVLYNWWRPYWGRNVLLIWKQCTVCVIHSRIRSLTILYLLHIFVSTEQPDFQCHLETYAMYVHFGDYYCNVSWKWQKLGLTKFRYTGFDSVACQCVKSSGLLTYYSVLKVFWVTRPPVLSVNAHVRSVCIAFVLTWDCIQYTTGMSCHMLWTSPTSCLPSSVCSSIRQLFWTLWYLVVQEVQKEQGEWCVGLWNGVWRLHNTAALEKIYCTLRKLADQAIK